MQYPILDLADFCLILTLFVLPAIFSAPGNSVNVPDASSIPVMTVVIYSVLVIYMAVRYHQSAKPSYISESADSGKKRSLAGRLLSHISNGFTQTFVTLISILISNTIISKLAVHYGNGSLIPAINVNVTTTADKAVLFFWTLLLASFEEFAYRWLIPARLRSLVLRNGKEDELTITKKALCELAVLCLFALAHRYMGWWAVLNAFLAGIIFRSRYFLSGSVYPALAAHTLYNLIAFYGILNA